MRKLFLLFGITAVCIFCCVQADAHLLWVYPESSHWVVARGTSSENMLPYSPTHITQIRAWDKEGEEIAVQRKDEAERSVFQTDRPVALAAVTCEWGMRVNTNEGKKLMDKEQALAQGLEVKSTFISSQYSKTFFRKTSCWSTPIGLKLEILPLVTLNQAGFSRTLAVQVLFDGKPLARCKVFSEADRKGVITDLDGKADIPIRLEGMQRIWAHHEIPLSNDPVIDYHQCMSFLNITFQ
jgi:uncharacterized GH25 family protein